MNAKKICPECGKPLEADAPDGLCPECWMKMGLGTDADPGPESQAASGPKPFVTPTPEEIGAHFPQLEMLELLGQGGMGVVYKARQPRLNRFVALKILAPEREQEPAFGERFTREAQTLAGLNHPNIVVVYDFGKVNGLFYLVMEYVEGVSLRQLLQRKKLPPEEALAIVPPICEALQYAHEQGVVHRDIKPENVLLDKAGRVKIADFGIAKIVRKASPAGALTEPSQVIGTPHYMAPEQVEEPQQVDHRADIYSLGVVFYEMLTGELPLGKFPAPSSLARGIAFDVRLDEIVLHALEKEPGRRYQHASEVKADIETVTVTHVPQATGSLGPEWPPRFEVDAWSWLLAARWCARLLAASGVFPAVCLLRRRAALGLALGGALVGSLAPGYYAATQSDPPSLPPLWGWLAGLVLGAAPGLGAFFHRKRKERSRADGARTQHAVCRSRLRVQ